MIIQMRGIETSKGTPFEVFLFFAIFLSHFAPASVECGRAHIAALGSFFGAELVALPGVDDLCEVRRELQGRAAQVDAAGAGGGNAFGLAFADIVPFVVRGK